ncbi:ABC transporter permease, partial [Escherichia coli]|uniref:ABC transporter permease n=1 Tax=Escherichia coli TaxID=562 RepID=UPI003B02B6F7
DSGMDTGEFTFVLNIPPGFQRDVLAGRSPEVQLNIDATRMSQAFTGNNYIQQVVMGEVNEFVRRYRSVDNLLVMPVTPGEIMASKVTAMGLVVLVATAASLNFVVRGLLGVPIEGSIPLFLCGAVLCLFAMTSMGIYLATLSRSMPQFGLLL